LSVFAGGSTRPKIRRTGRLNVPKEKKGGEKKLNSIRGRKPWSHQQCRADATKMKRKGKTGKDKRVRDNEKDRGHRAFKSEGKKTWRQR